MRKSEKSGRDQRLTLALAHAGLNNKQLAEQVGVTAAAISFLRGGSSPMVDLWQRVAKVLAISPDWLLHGSEPAPRWAVSPRMAEVAGASAYDADPIDPDHDYPLPVLGLAAAANGDSTQGTQLDEHPPIRIRRRWRGVKITGRSAEPIVLKGQTVIVDPAIDAKPDSVVVIQTRDDQLLKRWIGESNGTIFLASLNAGIGSVLLPAKELLHRPLVVVGSLWTDLVAR